MIYRSRTNLGQYFIMASRIRSRRGNGRVITPPAAVIQPITELSPRGPFWNQRLTEARSATRKDLRKAIEYGSEEGETEWVEAIFEGYMGGERSRDG